jgi:hypothetical protein
VTAPPRSDDCNTATPLLPVTALRLASPSRGIPCAIGDGLLHAGRARVEGQNPRRVGSAAARPAQCGLAHALSAAAAKTAPGAPVLARRQSRRLSLLWPPSQLALLVAAAQRHLCAHLRRLLAVISPSLPSQGTDCSRCFLLPAEQRRKVGANRNLFVIHARAWRWAHLAARVCVCVGLAAMASPVQSPRGSNPMKSPRGSNPMKSPRQMEGKKTWQVVHNHRPLSPYSLSQTSLPLTLSRTSMGGRGGEGAAAAHPCAARGASMCGPRDRARAHAPAAADPVRRSLLPAPSCVRRLAGDKDFVGRRGSCQRW